MPTPMPPPHFTLISPPEPDDSSRDVATTPSAFASQFVMPQMRTEMILARPSVAPNVISAALINPAIFNGVIGTVRTVGVPRNQVQVPIASGASVTDESLFEDAATPAQKYYLPRYRLLEQNQMFRITLGPRAGNPGWALTVDLEKYPAPRLGEAARGAREITHAVSVMLRHRLRKGDPNSGQKELELREVTRTEAGLRAVLAIGSLDERDLLYQVLTDGDWGATFLVRRLITVATPVMVALRDLAEERDTASDAVINMNLVAASLQRPNPMLGTLQPFRPGGPIDQIAMPLRPNPPIGELPPPIRPRPPIDFPPTPKPPVKPPEPPKPPQPQGPLFRTGTYALDDVAERNPFVFDTTLHAYIFQGITGAGGKTFQPVLFQVPWRDVRGNEVARSYYQDPVNPHRFYFLPDEFVILRRPAAPRAPALYVTITSADGALETTQVTLDYYAFPVIDPSRLDAAEARLKREPGVVLPPGVTRLDFQPLPTDKAQLTLRLPQPDGSIANRASDAVVDLRAGFQDSFTLRLQDFKGIYDALFSPSATLFQGNVAVSLSDTRTENIPFRARTDELAGDLFEYGEAPHAESGGVTATLRNAIESPVRIKSLPVQLCRANTARECVGVPVQARLEGLTLPQDLAPGEAITFVVRPNSPLPGSGPTQAVFNLRGVEIRADKDTIWEAIQVDTAEPMYSRSIKVQTFEDTFGDNVLFIGVDFQSGKGATFTRGAPPEKLEVEVKVPAPIGNIILDKPDPGEYRFKLSVVRSGGKKSQDQDWRSDWRTTLLITSDDLPPAS